MPGLAVVEEGGVRVITPLLPHGMTDADVVLSQRSLLDAYLDERRIRDFVCWYYTPMALRFSDHLRPRGIIYDCMDELAAFKGACPELMEQEQKLFAKADVVFAGGASLYAAKKTKHKNVHLQPSSIDREHFAAARTGLPDPADQADIPHPRIGFFGVLDERLDLELLRQLAPEHPDWHFVLLGPVVKIREDELPTGLNIHYLGKKDYAELPNYLANWDVAMLPFALNASTRFISPTKTPEYLAAGKSVVSTPIQDVVKPYGEMGLVRIAGNAKEFGDAIEACMEDLTCEWLEGVDRFLALNSWDKTFEAMWEEIQRCMPRARQVPQSTEA